MTSQGNPTHDRDDRTIEFVLDLSEHETRRLTAMLAAIGHSSGWDPIRVLADETEAHRKLYADLDPVQQAVYDMLIEEGVLDEAA